MRLYDPQMQRFFDTIKARLANSDVPLAPLRQELMKWNLPVVVPILTPARGISVPDERSAAVKAKARSFTTAFGLTVVPGTGAGLLSAKCDGRQMR